MEEHFGSPSPLPPEILIQITADIGDEFQNYGCAEERLEAVLEGKTIQIGPAEKIGFLVRPKSVCACAVYACPFWVFVADPSGKYKLFGKINAHTLTIDGSKSVNGLFQLEAYLGTAGWEDLSKWSYDGKNYVETERNYIDKNSSEEISPQPVNQPDRK
jgi:hypothetical protein